MDPDDPSARTLLVDTADLAADASALDLLARLQVVACRCGYRLQLSGSSPELRDLIGFAGLDQALPEETLGLEAGR